MAEITDVIRRLVQEHQEFIKQAEVALRYYLNANDIIKVPVVRLNQELEKQLAKLNNPLRNADNRIPHNWHQLLVDQKTSYAFTYAPMFSVGDNEDAKAKAINDLIAQTLGDDFTRYCKDLCLDASNSGTAWLHYWLDPADETFQYAPVPAIQIVPVYSGSLKRKLLAVLRGYIEIGEDNEEWERFEYWTEREVRFYERKAHTPFDELRPMIVAQVANAEGAIESTNITTHPFGRVPFIEFANNKYRKSDLDKYKQLVDLYDKIFSGFGNDLEDIQEVIFLIKNYGREDLGQILQNLKIFKAVKLEDDDKGRQGGVDTLTIDIPVEARKVALEILRRQIFVSGQGVDPDPEKFGTASGVALRFLYSLLEMKAGLLETEFRSGFNELTRVILQYHGVAVDSSIVQTWTRNVINNELENAQIGKMLSGMVSEETILRNLFWVDDPIAELERLQKERSEQTPVDLYGQLTPKPEGEDEDGDEERG